MDGHQHTSSMGAGPGDGSLELRGVGKFTYLLELVDTDNEFFSLPAGYLLRQIQNIL